MDQREQNSALEAAFSKGITYGAYNQMLQMYAQQGRTSGEQKPSYIEYTKLSAARQRRWDKTYSAEVDFIDALGQRKIRGERWLVFSETWCGDAAHALPLLSAWATAVGISLRIVFRDQHPELMDQFSINGARSIPRLIRMTDEFDVRGMWGPRPSGLTHQYDQWKADPNFDRAAWARHAQEWYNKDKGRNLENDILDMMS